MARRSSPLVFAASLCASLCAGCEGVSADDAFTLNQLYPADGGVGHPQTVVRLAFSEPPDETACEAALALSALLDDGRVAWDAPFVFAEPEDGDGNTFHVEPDELLAIGFTYAITVDDSCRAADRDEPVAPFVGRFLVEPQ